MKKGPKITIKKATNLFETSPSPVNNTSKILISDSKSIKAKIDNTTTQMRQKRRKDYDMTFVLATIPTQ